MNSSIQWNTSLSSLICAQCARSCIYGGCGVNGMYSAAYCPTSTVIHRTVKLIIIFILKLSEIGPKRKRTELLLYASVCRVLRHTLIKLSHHRVWLAFLCLLGFPIFSYDIFDAFVHCYLLGCEEY